MKLSNPIRKILAGMGVCLVSCLAATHVYLSAGWSLIDSIYMVVITLFGIGYGEVRPISDPLLKIQTISFIIVGCLSGLYSIGGFVQLLTEGEIRRALGEHKMSKGLKKMKNHTIVCGFGRVGKMLAEQLSAQKEPFVIVDLDQSRLDTAAEAGYMVVVGDASTDEVLEQAGISSAKTLACVLPKDAINVFITLTARDLNADLEIIARAENPSTEHKLRRSGADYVVMPAAIGAMRMAQLISQPENQRPQATTKQRLQTVPVSSIEELEERTLGIAKRTLEEVGAVIGVQRNGTEILTELHDELELASNDVLLVSEQRTRPRRRQH